MSVALISGAADIFLARRESGLVTTEAAQLQRAIERRHECKARLVATEMVSLEFKVRAPWAGVVYHFALDGHPTADLAYAWSMPPLGRRRAPWSIALREGADLSAPEAVRNTFLSDIESD